MTYDPFEDVEPLRPLEDGAVLISLLKRSILWDLIGPDRIRKDSEHFGMAPASPEVFDKEFEEMIRRKYSLLPIRDRLSLMCYIAAESASHALMTGDKKYSEMTPEDKLQFRLHNVSLASVVADSVISHMLQDGSLHYGGHP